MAYTTKERSSTVKLSGRQQSPTGRVTTYNLDYKYWHQRTYSEEHPLFKFVQLEKRERNNRMPDYWLDFMSRQDLGGAFRTETGSLTSTLRDFAYTGNYTGAWSWSHSGPMFPVGFKTPLQMATSQEIINQNAVLFALGGSAISRTRPGKPQVDLATAIGELRMGGVPTLIGSLYQRAYNFKQLVRESGNEYLNLQFGWAPFIKDIQGLANAVLSTRALLEAHEKQLNKLLRRTYRFETQRDTSEGLTKSLSSYELDPAPGSFSYVGTRVQLGQQVPVEITQHVTNSHFSGGFRFFYPEIDTALRDLQRMEGEANILLGTRLDPEVLWNLQPWTWLADWFINFGDVLGNLSAIISDGLVIQYGYIMQENVLRKEITFPKGLFLNNFPGSSSFTMKPWTVESIYRSKVRAAASPFGFGLTPEMFSPQQWAILAALGISRGLK